MMGNTKYASPALQSASRRAAARQAKRQHLVHGKPRWRIPLLAGSAAFVVGALALWLVQVQSIPSYVPEVLGRPSAMIDQTRFDYGEVKNNTPVTTVFRVKNVGDRDLTFQGNPRVEVVEGCCPPQATLGDMRLRPGEETAVKLRFMMHDGMDGPHDFRVHVATNDPENPDQQVVILSNWIP